MHTQLAQSIADSQPPGIDGHASRPTTGRPDAVSSFHELLRPSGIAARLSVSYDGSMAFDGPMALTAAALPERDAENAPPVVRTDRDSARRRAGPDRDGANARTIGRSSASKAHVPDEPVGSEQELASSDARTEAPADEPEIEPARNSRQKPDTESVGPAEPPLLPLLSVPSETPSTADRATVSEASAGTNPAIRNPLGPLATDPADAPRRDPSTDSAPMRVSVRTEGEGLSSRPASLLVPQAVLADAGEMAAAPPSPNAPINPIATAPVAAGVSALELAGAARQATLAPGPAEPSPGSPVQAPTEPAAPPSPIAIEGLPGTGDAGDGDLAGAEQGFSSGAGAHAPLVARAAGATDRPLATKSLALQVAPHVAKAAKAGLTRIEIALEPASLGKVEVRLDFGRDGSVNVLFVAESREALDALRADARTLERALSEAGLEADSGSLGFSLRGQGAGTGDSFSKALAGRENPSEISAESALDRGSGSAADNPMFPATERRLDIRA